MAAGQRKKDGGRRATSVLLASCLLSSSCFLLVARAQTATTNISYEDVKAIVDVLRDDLLPAELRTNTTAGREALWPDWASRRDAAIRARLARADEDSLLNLLLLGTTFTRHPRVTELASLRAADAAARMAGGRADDLVGALAASSGDERMRFAREVIAGAGIAVETPTGRRQAREYLFAILARVTRETEEFARTVAAMSRLDDPVAKLALDATIYRDRGLSPDTSIVPSFGIERALSDLRTVGRLGPNSVRRVAIVGPGLDLVDKREGYDFYPVQTIQPFAVVDSLARLGLSSTNDLRVTTFDVSPRVNGHLEAARRRAAGGSGYLVHLPLGPQQPWTAELRSYWSRFGDSIGEEALPATLPPAAGVQVRALRVRPDTVQSIVPRALNIVLQRLSLLPPAERFDLVIATNVLIYYDVFEQSLALANIATMLRPGGLLLSNTLVAELPQLPMALVAHTDIVYTETGVGDRILCYERR